VTRKGPFTLAQRAGYKSQRKYDSQDVDGPLHVMNREYAHSGRTLKVHLRRPIGAAARSARAQKSLVTCQQLRSVSQRLLCMVWLISRKKNQKLIVINKM